MTIAIPNANANGLLSAVYAPVFPWSWCCWFNIDNVAGTSLIGGTSTADGAGNFYEAYCDASNLHWFLNGSDSVIMALSSATWYWMGVSGTVTAGTLSLVIYTSTGLGAIATTTKTGANTVTTNQHMMFGRGLSAGDPGLGGKIAASKTWLAALTADELANERTSWVPRRTNGIYSFPGVINAGSTLGIDLTGQGNNFGTTGAIATDRNSPPIPWLGAA